MPSRRLQFRPREVHVLATLAFALLAALTFTARFSLNPDGVSYLDLAAVLGNGNGPGFVQSYWSPLYPALFAAFSKLTGLGGPNLIPNAHLVNLGFLFGTLVILVRWAARIPDPAFGRAAIASLLLCSFGPPRVEAVTPDLLLILVLTALSYQLVVLEGKRWLVTGLLMGGAFLVKTSIWPWLLIGAGIRLWAAGDGKARGAVLRSTLVAAAVMLVWIVPLSRKEGRLTMGSSGRLNYCWYLAGCDSRIPDAHRGAHRAYQQVLVPELGTTVTVARFDQADSWTYQPWADPTSWAEGVQLPIRTPPTLFQLLAYWFQLAAAVFGRWLLPLLLTVLLPVVWSRRRMASQATPTARRSALVLIILGLMGLGQFIAVHAEPRLIAPFALMLALGTLQWTIGTGAPAQASGRRSRWGPEWLGVVAAVAFCIVRITFGLDVDRRLAGTITELRETGGRFAEAGVSMRRIAIVGQAMPVVATAYLVQGHIVGQILPESAQAVFRLPRDQQQSVIDRVFAGRADVAWLVGAGGGVQFLPVGPTRVP